MQTEGPAGETAAFRSARNAALRFRGEILDHFGQVEQALSLVLVKAAAMPEYAALRPAFPHSVGLRLERLRRLLDLPGPLAGRRPAMAPLVERLSDYEELRHFMAHGALEIAVAEHGEPLYVFAFIQTKGGRPRDARLTLDRREARRLAARVGADAAALTAELEALNADPPEVRLPQATVAPGAPDGAQP